MCVCVLFNLKRPAIKAILRVSEKMTLERKEQKKSSQSDVPHYASKQDRYTNFAADILCKSFFFAYAVMGSRWELALLATYPIWDGIFMEKTTRSDIRETKATRLGLAAESGGCCSKKADESAAAEHSHAAQAANSEGESCCAKRKDPINLDDEKRIHFADQYLKTHSGYLYASQITSTMMAAAYVTLFGAATASVSVSGLVIPTFVIPLVLNLAAECYHFYYYSKDANKLVDKFNGEASEAVSAADWYNVLAPACCQV